MFSYIGKCKLYAYLQCTQGTCTCTCTWSLGTCTCTWSLGTCTRTCTWGLSTCTCTRTWGLGTCTCTCTWGLSTWYISGPYWYLLLLVLKHRGSRRGFFAGTLLQPHWHYSVIRTRSNQIIQVFFRIYSNLWTHPISVQLCCGPQCTWQSPFSSYKSPVWARNIFITINGLKRNYSERYDS